MTTDVKYTQFEQLTIGNNNQSNNEVEFLRNTDKKEKEMRLCVFLKGNIKNIVVHHPGRSNY